MASNSIKNILTASPMDLLRGDLEIVSHNLNQAQRALEEATGGRQTWLDPVVAIARDRAKNPLSHGLPAFDSLAAENEKLRAALYGKYGVRSGLDIIEKCLETATKADHADAPFPFDTKEAAIYHRAQQDAYRHVLEMVSLPEDLSARADKENPSAAALLRAALTYIESPEKVNVDWLSSSLQRSIAGIPPVELPVKKGVLEAELAREFTVIGHSEADGGLFFEHVYADNGLKAFAAAAGRHPDAEFSVAVAGWLKAYDGSFEFPGESIVSASTIKEQPDVFGTINFGVPNPGFLLLFPGATEDAANAMLNRLKRGGNTVFPVDAMSAAELLESYSAEAREHDQNWTRIYNFSADERSVANKTWGILTDHGFDADWTMGILESGRDYRYVIELPNSEVERLRELQNTHPQIFPVNLIDHTPGEILNASGPGYAVALLDETTAVVKELIENLRAGGISVYLATADEADPILAEVAHAAGLTGEDFEIKF